MVTGQCKIQCPFCKKHTIEAFHRPSHLEGKVTHISAGTRRKYIRVPESYEVLSGCSECGKSYKEVKRHFESGGIEKTHEERMKRLQASGLPTKIVSKRN